MTGLNRWAVITALLMIFWIPLCAQDSKEEKTEEPEYSFSADLVPVSKYLWRGQRLTNDWSLQASGTLGIGPFYVNIWGNLDLTAVNEGDVLLIKENPEAPIDEDVNGLQGRFSEIDFAFYFAKQLKNVTLSAGTFFYVYPDRSVSLPTTAEIFGSVEFSEILFQPSLAMFVDVDEAVKRGSTGLYFQVSGSHLFDFDFSKLQGLEIGGGLGISNDGFANLSYGTRISGLHDFYFSILLPIQSGEAWSIKPFLSYSALLGEFRNHQYLDPRKVYLGTAGCPAASADTVWGGLIFRLEF